MVIAENYLSLSIPAVGFGADLDACEDATREIDDVIDQLSDNEEFAWGCTKFVIIPSKTDFVIKIPFDGQYVWNYEEQELDYEEFRNHDYCAIEEDEYERARMAGFGCFYARVWKIGNLSSGKPIYAQEKIKTTVANADWDPQSCENNYEDSYTETADRLSSDTYDKMGKHVAFSRYWVAEAIKYYGEELVKEFLIWSITNLSDMHRNNYGYRFDGSPVIHDYSGFYED